MKFCEQCRAQNDWPGSVRRLRGKCQWCGGDPALCHDVPASMLVRLTPEQLAELAKEESAPAGQAAGTDGAAGAVVLAMPLARRPLNQRAIGRARIPGDRPRHVTASQAQ